MRFIHPFIACLQSVAFLLITSCASAPVPTAPGLGYSEPNVSEVPVAFLKGYALPGYTFTLFTSSVFAIDGRRVLNGADRWNVPVPVLPGRVFITAEFNKRPYFARADLDLPAVAGEDYIIKFVTDVGSSDGNSFCEFWIENAVTGKTVSPAMRANVQKR